MTRNTITEEKILEDMGYEKKKKLRLTISVIGMALVLWWVFWMILLGSLAFAFAFFHLIASCIWGIVPLKKLNRARKNVLDGTVMINQDVVVKKKKAGQRNLILFKECTARTEKGVRVSALDYEAAKKGDKFWLIYVEGQTEPIACYPAADYTLSESLMGKEGCVRERITHKRIVKDSGVRIVLTCHTVMMLVGIAAVVSPVIIIGEWNHDAFLSTLFMSFTFGILFGIAFGFVPLMKGIKLYVKIKNGRYTVEKDRVKDKQLRELNDNRECLLMFENYTAKTGRGVFQSYRVYEKVKRGEEFYLIYVDGQKEPVAIYSARRYRYDGISCYH